MCILPIIKIQVLLGGYVKNRVQVESFYEQELEEGTILNGMIMNSYSLQSSLSEMRKAHNLPTKSVFLTVNGSSITVKPIKVPQAVPKNVSGLIRTEFREMENIQNLLIDYSVINSKNADGSSSILAALSTREFIMNYVDLFREAKIELGIIDLLQNCLIKLMRHLKSMQNKTYAIFMLDQSTMT
ncbi:MAG: pilus assembly protein PilM [Ruminococcus sp.]|nr:pilus assembly protein PilM [Ruminococcus sp.]